MAIASAAVHKVYSIAAGTVATVAAQKLLSAGWEFVTGEEPPEPTDPEADGTSAVLWALASAVGLAVAQVMAQRLGNRLFLRETGHRAKPQKINMKI